MEKEHLFLLIDKLNDILDGPCTNTQEIAYVVGHKGQISKINYKSPRGTIEIAFDSYNNSIKTMLIASGAALQGDFKLWPGILRNICPVGMKWRKMCRRLEKTHRKEQKEKMDEDRLVARTNFNYGYHTIFPDKLNDILLGDDDGDRDE